MRLGRWASEGRTSLMRSVLVAIVAFGLAIALSNCDRPSSTNQTSNSPSSPANNPAAPPGALVYGSGGEPVNLDPGNIEDGNSTIVQEQIYDRLIDFKSGSSDLEPGLATEWNPSEGGKVWTFKLRSGVKFHDGTDFDAEAVRFNVDRWWNPDSDFGYRDAGKTYIIWNNLFGGFKGSPGSVVQDVVVEGKDSIKFVLKQPLAIFPAIIASGYFGIASPTAIKKAGASYGTPSSLAVGTGAFVFKEWRTGDQIVLSKNPNYWKKGIPKSEQLIFRFITAPAARLAQLRAGTIDMTVDLTPDQMPEVQRDANLDAVFRPSFNVGYLALNPSYEPLQKREVRQAIALAINRREIVKAFWGEMGETTPHFTPPLQKEFQSEKVTAYPYNPPVAQQVIADAGYPKGFDLQLWYMPVSRPYFPTPKQTAEAFAAELSAIGIKVSLQSKDWAAYLSDRNKSPGYQAFMLGWMGDYGDPDSFYYPHFSAGATTDLGNWKNEKVFQLLDRGRATQDKAERIKIYQQVDQILFEEAVRIPIVHSKPLLAKRKRVSGWTPSPLGSESLGEVTKS